MRNALPETCPDSLFEQVKKYIAEFDLDNRSLAISQFITLRKEDKLLAFGRLRRYEGCEEICSIGVIEEARHLGLAHKLIEKLNSLSSQPLYLVSIIPEFFGQFGFQICQDFPPEIREKLDYCLNSLPVPEPYVVMRLERTQPGT